MLFAAGVHPAQKLLLYLPYFLPLLDVLLRGARVPVGRAAVVDKVHHGIKSGLRHQQALALVGHCLGWCQVVLQKLLGLVLCNLVARLHVLGVAVAYG